MNFSITFLEENYEALLSLIFAEPGLEGAAYLLCGSSRTDQEHRLLVKEVIPVRPEHYLKRAPLQLSICSDSYVPVAKRARELKQSVVFVHSHPDGVDHFSSQDDEEEPRLMEFLSRRVPECTHGAMVISGPSSVSARMRIDGHVETVSRVRVIGQRFQFFDVTKNDKPLPHFFDRQVRAFGPEVQRLLARLHVGIVGAGGTGSAVFEQLVRLGVGKISIFDYDVFDSSNVNRVYGSAARDAGGRKVDIACTSAERIGVGTTVLRFPMGISFERSAKALRDCDAVFGCTDKEAPRAILTQLSIRYLIPLFDMAAVIDSKELVIRGIFGRVTTFFPGEACLFCRGRITPEAIRLEGLDRKDREALAREGYVPELETAAPAVIMFTTAVAAQAVCELLHRLTGFMGKDRVSSEVLLKFHETSVGRNREKPSEKCFCSQKKLWGRGDSRSFLDLTWPAEPIDLPI